MSMILINSEDSKKKIFICESDLIKKYKLKNYKKIKLLRKDKYGHNQYLILSNKIYFIGFEMYDSLGNKGILYHNNYFT